MAQIIVGDKSAIQDHPFEDEVHDMGDFIVAHPSILGPEIRIIARELQVSTEVGQKRMDFLAFDTENGQIDIVELKKSVADEKVLLQTLRYANWIRNNLDTVRYHSIRTETSSVPGNQTGLAELAPLGALRAHMEGGTLRRRFP